MAFEDKMALAWTAKLGRVSKWQRQPGVMVGIWNATPLETHYSTDLKDLRAKAYKTLQIQGPSRELSEQVKVLPHVQITTEEA